MVVSYTVLNIYRIYENNLFIIALFSDKIEYFRIDKSLTERISKGMAYVGDRIVIKQNTNDGIIFEIDNNDILDDPPVTSSDAEFFYVNSKKIFNDSHHNYIPFLCDVLPYNTEKIKEEEAKPIIKKGQFIGKYLIDQKEVSNIKIPLPPSFIAKVVHKTRINLYPGLYNPFFFAIISSNDIYIKAVFWKETLNNFSSLKVGDIIQVRDYKLKRKWTASDKIEFNTFTESLYFDVEEITVKDMIKIKYDKKTLPHKLFETIKGEIEYLSLILRMNLNGSLMEYVLMKVDNKNVVLFYNSDTEFYKIQAGSKIIISELRRIARANTVLFISTIYTQFEIGEFENIDIDAVESEEIQKKHKVVEEKDIGSNLFENESSLSLNVPNLLFDVSHDCINRAVFAQKEEHIQTEKGLITEKITKIEKTFNANSKTFIFGAVGFIPDNFKNLTDITDYQDKEMINKTDVSIGMFFKPTILSLTELSKQHFVLNEVKKFIVSTKVIKITDLDCAVSYFENNQTKTQGSFQLILEDDFKIYVYENFFIKNSLDLVPFESSDEKSIIGKELNLAIEGFRADEESVIYYLTGVIDNNLS